MSIMQPKYNYLYQGDCLEIMQEWSDGCIDHAIIDPPFNMSKKKGLGWAFSSHVTMNEEWDMFSREAYLEFSRRWISEICRLVKKNGNIFIFGSYHNIYDIGFIINEFGLRIVNSLVWFKPNAQPNITRRMLTESTEYVIWICNAPKDTAKNWVFHYELAKKFNSGKQLRNVWQIPYPSQSERKYGKHPSQKSLDFVTRIVLIATNPDDVILDCFAGSGTTGVVAKNFDRKWVMIEKNPDYVDIAKKRLKNVKLSLPPEIKQLQLDI